MEKKYLIAPTYSLLGRKFLTWQEAEDLAYWEKLYFSEEKTVSFFFKCEGLV